MNPCSKNRKLIVWLTLDALDDRKASALRAHLATCEGCRRYREEISHLTENLLAAELDSELEAPASFHRAVAARLRTAKPSPLRYLALSPSLRRFALPTAVGLVVVLFAMVKPRHFPAPPLAVSPSRPLPAASASNVGRDVPPTLAIYRSVAGQSLQQLDELLTRQGNAPLPPAPGYTASARSLADGSL